MNLFQGIIKWFTVSESANELKIRQALEKLVLALSEIDDGIWHLIIKNMSTKTYLKFSRDLIRTEDMFFQISISRVIRSKNGKECYVTYNILKTSSSAKLASIFSNSNIWNKAPQYQVFINEDEPKCATDYRTNMRDLLNCFVGSAPAQLKVTMNVSNLRITKVIEQIVQVLERAI